MTIEEIEDYCKNKHKATEEFPFGDVPICKGECMSNGIIIIGLNGSGKSTVCRELAQRLNYKRMDVEDYYFPEAEIPYTVSRSREEVERMIIEDINKYKNYVLCSVNCNWNTNITDTFRLAVLLSAPLEIRMERIKQREVLRFGKRVLEGGDMYESQKRFHDFVTLRSAEDVRRKTSILHCPVLEIDATLPVGEIVRSIYNYYSKTTVGLYPKELPLNSNVKG